MLFVFFDSVNTRGIGQAKDCQWRFGALFTAVLACFLCLALLDVEASAQSRQSDNSLFVVPEFEELLASVDETGVPVIGIVPFEHKFGNVGNGMAILTERSMAKKSRGRLRIVSPQITVEELREQGFQGKIKYGGRRNLRQGKLDGFDYLLLGKVREFEMIGSQTEIGPFNVPFFPNSANAAVRIDYELIDLGTGKALYEKSVYASGSTSDFKVPRQSTWKATVDFLSPQFSSHPIGLPSLNAADEIANETVSIFPLFGKIADVMGNSVVLDFETDSPFAAGDIVEVFKENNRTGLLGEHLWTDAENVGTLVILEVRGARAICEILRGKGEISTGMKVKAPPAQVAKTS